MAGQVLEGVAFEAAFFALEFGQELFEDFLAGFFGSGSEFAHELLEGDFGVCHHRLHVREFVHVFVEFDGVVDVETGFVEVVAEAGGQVRGPVQLGFARSVDPIFLMDHTFTRAAVAEGEYFESSAQMLEWEKKQSWGKLQTIAGRMVIPYALYQVKGYISAHLAQDTGFGEKDLELLWAALQNMFEINRSATKGILASRALFIFKHVGTERSPDKRARQAQLGCAPAHRLVENGRVLTVRRGDGAKPARSFGDYEVAVDLGRMPGGVELTDIRC